MMGRPMRMGLLIVALGAALVASAAASEPCDTPSYLLHGDSRLYRVSAAVEKSKTLKILVLGTGSSLLAGPDGTSVSYPARLQEALQRRLPSLKVSVATEVAPRQSAQQMSQTLSKFTKLDAPTLVVWQTGTFEAMRGIDPEEFRAALADGVEKLQNGGSDVVLMNMQYSPRTDMMIAMGGYADAMRWVAREREVPLFDRLAIMRHWNESGMLDLYAATKDNKLAKRVHDCIGRTLAVQIIDAAQLEAFESKAPQ